MLADAVECETPFAEDLLGQGARRALSVADMRTYLELVADQRLANLGLAPMQVQALALVKDGRAYLVPQSIEVWVELLSSPLHRAGFQFVDLQSVRIDLETRELVVPELLLEVDAGALQDLQRSEGGAREPGAVAPGRYPIEAWAFFQEPGQQAPSAESILLQLFQSTANVFERGVPATLRTLESFAAAVRVGNLRTPPYHDSLAARIAALAAH